MVLLRRFCWTTGDGGTGVPPSRRDLLARTHAGHLCAVPYRLLSQALAAQDVTDVLWKYSGSFTSDGSSLLSCTRIFGLVRFSYGVCHARSHFEYATTKHMNATEEPAVFYLAQQDSCYLNGLTLSL